MKTTLIGLTGGIGSGKSTAALLFEELGIEFVDADNIAREVVQPGERCLKQIHDHFGCQILHSDGSLNRSALREIIFQNPDERIWLESVTHPAIRKRLIHHIDSMKGTYALLVHPLLFETSQHTLCQYTIALNVPRSLQLDRVVARDNNSKTQVERILDTQLSNEDRCSRADFILENTGNSADLSVKVSMLHNKLITLLTRT
ncbi:Dephospho-CoA kinase [Marinomonas gallaica]|uniref:Dephospho-CoA kinase n=1 Tax=Marinomonas gallaica TaxID=1806667 RepID=A0A1C3JUU0_9GAMM|nr:dephospho-CoA kinase [Marinomonas gallaica]SBT19008.1 Dephospho-CoA kinase [Marinomonas gallaica]SBT21963.1 Dephospho-CoA kinase [Marinomonas gallaica]